MLTIWNTPDRRAESFKPISGKHVGLYTCGPTVYGAAHIGNLRAFLFEDVLKRTLLLLGYDVKHVMNITDVGHLVGDGDVGEDKVEKTAAKTGKSAWDIAREYESLFLKDLARLHILKPDALPRATEHIAEQIALVKALEEKGYVYKTSDGLYFDTAKFGAYGKLGGQKLEEKEAGKRVAIRDEKRHPADFALWKFSPTPGAGPKRQMEWESPWGVGFPGWHIECSAMSVKYLGQPFDIHCGGVDHIAVHHENEIAQSEAATGKPLANYWMHSEFLLVDGKRMGKSEGNGYTLDDLIAKGFDPLAFRYFCLGAHYRSKINFTWEGLEGAQHALQKLRTIARALPAGRAHDHAPLRGFTEALENDLNTPEALAVMWDMLKSDATDEDKGSMLLKMDEVLGLGLAGLVGKKTMAPQEIVALAEQRQKARAEKDWAASDALRQQIEEKGWNVKDRDHDSFELEPKA